METVEAEIRKEKGKSAAKRLRESGFIPAIVYGKGIESLPLILDSKSFRTVMHRLAGKKVLFELKVKENDKILSKKVILKEIQRDLIKDEIVHLDFHEVTLGKTIEVNIPLTLVGEAPGVKEGGILDQVLREIKIETLPLHIPEEIKLDISSLKIGDSLYVKDIQKAKEITILTEQDDVVVSILAPRKEEEETAPVEEAEAEPEVISEAEAEERRKKKGEEKPAEEVKEPEKKSDKGKKPEKK